MGKNPFIDAEAPPLPSRPYTLTVKAPGEEPVRIQVDPANLPEAHEGHQGSLLSLLLENGIEIDHTCGGVCACSTCHVIVREGGDTANESMDEEEDQLDNAPGVTPQSRLACQCVPNGSKDVIVEVPGWNRNLVSEEHH